MKALLFDKYGTPDDLHLEDVEIPAPRKNEVLVRVKACSINSWDNELLQGIPFANRFMFGLFRPKKILTLGSDIAGVVEAVGSNVKKFRVGDEVFGDQSQANWGGFAEYTCAPEKKLIHKPEKLSFAQAAAMPQAGVLALQALRNFARVKPGQKVLISGAGGGSGSFGIQLAKMYGAEVTAVDTADKFEFMKSLGADHAIDYYKEDYTRTGKYDVIIDNTATRYVREYRRALRPGGVFGMVGGRSGSIFNVMFLGPFVSFGKKIGVVMHRDNKGLEELTQLVTSGKIKVCIDKVFPLQQGVEAFRYFAGNKFRGKVVIAE